MGKSKYFRRAKIGIIYLLSLMIVNLIATAAQELTQTPIPTKAQHKSIFANDTCTPPCWFGLIPGESTSLEVFETLKFLESSQQVGSFVIRQNGEWFHVDSENLLTIKGNYSYSFEFGPFEKVNCCIVASQAEINEGLLDIINIVARENITMDEVVTQLGLPDEVRLSRWAYTGTKYADFSIGFIYFDIYLRVDLAKVDLSPPSDVMCDFPAMRDQFLVSNTIYYSYERALELVDSPLEESEQQPALLIYQLEERHVPQEMKELLMGNTPISCQEMWDTLPEEQILPDKWEEEKESQ